MGLAYWASGGGGCGGRRWWGLGGGGASCGPGVELASVVTPGSCIVGWRAAAGGAAPRLALLLVLGGKTRRARAIRRAHRRAAPTVHDRRRSASIKRSTRRIA